MFVPAKRVGPHTYLQLVESFRDGARVRQRLCASLGRLDVLAADGGLDALTCALARCSDRLAVLRASGEDLRAPAAPDAADRAEGGTVGALCSPPERGCGLSPARGAANPI